MDPIQAARIELAQKTIKDIQRETALIWAARACAAFEFAREVDQMSCLKWWQDAIEYEHEAFEHAALADESGALLAHVRQLLLPYK